MRPQILQMAMESFGFADPDYRERYGDGQHDFGRVREFFAYFSTVLEDRRASPKDRFSPA